MMWYTFRKGEYDFGATEKNIVKLSHNSSYLDIFYMVNDGAVSLLNDFYQLTGNPVLLPKFGFYEGHLNAYNRDYWKEDEKGILFEDGKRYKESQKDNGGIKESLNGEKNNYQFSHVPLSTVTRIMICLSDGYCRTTVTEPDTDRRKHWTATSPI